MLFVKSTSLLSVAISTGSLVSGEGFLLTGKSVTAKVLVHNLGKPFHSLLSQIRWGYNIMKV